MWSVLSPVAPLPFSLVQLSLPTPPPFLVWISVLFTRIVCRGGGGYGVPGLRQINICRKVPLQVNSFRLRHFALPSMSRIFLRYVPEDWHIYPRPVLLVTLLPSLLRLMTNSKPSSAQNVPCWQHLQRTIIFYSHWMSIWSYTGRPKPNGWSNSWILTHFWPSLKGLCPVHINDRFVVLPFCRLST